MAVRVLLVVAVLATFYGCGQASSPLERGENKGAESKRATPSSSGQEHLLYGRASVKSTTPSRYEQQRASATASAAARLLTDAIPSDSAQRVKSTIPVRPGQQLAFGVRRPGGDYENDFDYNLYAMDSAGTDPTRLTDGAVPDWSPDGKQIAYLRFLKEPNPEASSANSSASPARFIEIPYIFIMNTDGSGGKQLLDKESLGPKWSPDGKKIAFTFQGEVDASTGEVTASCGIYIMNTAGTGTVKKLATGPGCASAPAWSPDGKKIAYTNGPGLNESGSDLQIYVADASNEEGHTNEPRALTDPALGYAGGPSWSPDGTEIAFTARNQDGRTSIYKMDADGGGMKPIAPFQHMRKLEASSAGWPVYDSKGDPVWSPDGEQIAYVRLIPDCDPNCVGGYTSYPSAIYVMNSDGSSPTLVKDFGTGHDVWGLDWRALP